MKLILSHASNPDIRPRGYWGYPTDPKRMTVRVSSAAEARTRYLAWIDRNELGAGNITQDAGKLFDDAGQLLGIFTYSGTLWSKDMRAKIPLEQIDNPHGKKRKARAGKASATASS